MIDTIADRAAPGYLMRGTAGPLAAVLRVLDEARGGLTVTPQLASAAHILAAELMTSICESCECATSAGDLCSECMRLSAQAAAHRLAAGAGA